MESLEVNQTNKGLNEGPRSNPKVGMRVAKAGRLNEAGQL